MADRDAWEEATRQRRQLAIAADAELRRRHPDQQHPPLRSAESHPDIPDQPDCCRSFRVSVAASSLVSACVT
jgi:hypothetical protein